MLSQDLSHFVAKPGGILPAEVDSNRVHVRVRTTFEIEVGAIGSHFWRPLLNRRRRKTMVAPPEKRHRTWVFERKFMISMEFLAKTEGL